MEEKIMPHYYSEKQKWKGAKNLITFELDGTSIILYTSSNVFSPKQVDKGTSLLLSSIVEYGLIPSTGTVLDLGTGYGIIGIYLAKRNPSLRVYMTDINPIALKLARLNAKENGVESRAVILEKNVFQGFCENMFEAIYTNPPISAGYTILKKIVSEAPKYLRDRGYLVMVMSKGGERIFSLGQEFFSVSRIIARKKGYDVLFFMK
jgi:16S rRNA (guanine1207-N2)-methyltransferase